MRAIGHAGFGELAEWFPFPASASRPRADIFGAKVELNSFFFMFTRSSKESAYESSKPHSEFQHVSATVLASVHLTAQSKRSIIGGHCRFDSVEVVDRYKIP